jgi:hypothetical protein
MLEEGTRGEEQIAQSQGTPIPESILRTKLSRVAPNLQGADQVELIKRENVVDALRDLIISYTGLVLMDPTMFPQQVV